MGAVETLASLGLVAIAAICCYGLGRLLGWSIIFMVMCVEIGFKAVKWVYGKLQIPVKHYRNWKTARELNHLLEESINADDRRALRRKADDFLDYPRPRVLPLRVITNPNIQ